MMNIEKQIIRLTNAAWDSKNNELTEGIKLNSNWDRNMDKSLITWIDKYISNQSKTNEDAKKLMNSMLPQGVYH